MTPHRLRQAAALTTRLSGWRSTLTPVLEGAADTIQAQRSELMRLRKHCRTLEAALRNKGK